jgi:4-hydroxy-tetrahydrodipicolinate synthase
MATKAQASCITPFKRNGDLDEQALREHLQRMLAAGLDIDIGTSGTGEGHLISPAENHRILSIAAEEVGDKANICALGVEPRSANEMVEFHELVASTGVRVAQIYSLDMGHGYQPGRPELERYFRTVLDKTTLRVWLSTHQVVGYMVPLELLADLVADYEQIDAVICSTDDVGYLVALHHLVGASVSIYTGGPRQAATNLSLGGAGWGSAEANLVPRFCAEVCEAFNAGDIQTMGERYSRVMRVWTANSRSGGSVGIKAVLRRLGLPGGYSREPRLDRSEDEVDDLIEVLRAVGTPEVAATT